MSADHAKKTYKESYVSRQSPRTATFSDASPRIRFYIQERTLRSAKRLVKVLKKVGLVTIGQTPRVDVVPWLRKMMSREVQFLESGALDGLGRNEISRLKPKDNRDLLVSRMTDGSEVLFGKSHVIPRLQKCIDELNSKGAEAIALLCAGDFPEFESKAPVVRPDLLVYGFLKSIPNLKKVGLLVPNERQMEPIGKELQDQGFTVVTSWLSPYTEGSVEDAVRLFKSEDVTALCLLCMGYTPTLKEKIVSLTSKPAVLPQSVLAKAIDELIT